MEKIKNHINKRCVNCEHALLHFNKFITDQNQLFTDFWINKDDYNFYINVKKCEGGNVESVRCLKFGDASRDYDTERIVDKCIVWKRNLALKKIKKL